MPTSKKSNHKRLLPVTIRNAKLLYLNLAGKAQRFNIAGSRNFLLVLDPEDAKLMQNDGWNIKWKKARDPQDPDYPTLKVFARFENYPPSVVMISGKKRIELNEKTVGILDRAKITKFDIVITSSYWENPTGESGYKAYLQQMFATLSPDDLEADYMQSEE